MISLTLDRQWETVRPFVVALLSSQCPWSAQASGVRRTARGRGGLVWASIARTSSFTSPLREADDLSLPGAARGVTRLLVLVLKYNSVHMVEFLNDRCVYFYEDIALFPQPLAKWSLSGEQSKDRQERNCCHKASIYIACLNLYTVHQGSW